MRMKKNKSIFYGLLLLLTSTMWGFAFVAQRMGMDHMGPFTFSFVRFLLGSFILIPVSVMVVRKNKRKNEVLGTDTREQVLKNTIIGGLVCGVCLSVASGLQQYAIQYTSVGKAGFITTLYIVLVPILGIFLKRRVSILVAISVFISVIGIYFLCVPKGERLAFSGADQLLFLSALTFAVHILLIAHFSPKGRPVVIANIQFFVTGILSAIVAFIFEVPTLEGIWAGRNAIIFTGIFSCAVAYTIQMIAQEHVEPTTASLIMSMESVISAIAGWLVLGQAMNGREISGALLMFAAMILAQIPIAVFVQIWKRVKCAASQS